MHENPAVESDDINPCTLIIKNDQVKSAWVWFLTDLHPRPEVQPGNCCIYDQKHWGIEEPSILIKDNPDTIQRLAIIYLTSQLAGCSNDILQILDKNSRTNVCIYTPILDPDIRVVISSEQRFRHSLSEHLAFWVQFATIYKSITTTCFALSLPNFHPEDKGPDGMSLSLDNDQDPKVELRSAKSSIRNPYYLVASAHFRNGGEAKKDNLLEEFHLISTKGYGFSRLDRLLSELCQSINLPVDHTFRAGLLGSEKLYNAFVIADDQHAGYEMFSCYHRVSTTPQKCIATYIGSDVWAHLSERVRNCVVEILENAGVW